MPKIFPEEQRKMVRDLASQGMSHVDIAKAMAEKFPVDWGAKNASRTVARFLKDNVEVITTEHSSPKTLDEMTRDERFRFIELRLQNTARFKMAFNSFAKTEKEVFVEEYLNVIKSTETLTEVEEQSLFASVLELILAFQALNRKEAEEKLRDQSLSGEIKETDVRFRRVVDDKYQREYDQHMKLYQKGMDQLKMSRSQRLKEVRSQKQTLVDLAEELSQKNAQSEVAEEITRFAKLKDEELKRLLDLGHLHGVFEEFQ